MLWSTSYCSRCRQNLISSSSIYTPFPAWWNCCLANDHVYFLVERAPGNHQRYRRIDVGISNYASSTPSILRRYYYNGEDFWYRLKDKLLPEVNRLRLLMVIVMDNLSIHAKEEVRQVIEEAGHLVRYLPLSSFLDNLTHFLLRVDRQVIHNNHH
jgi:hypothetical protein